jgi:hypothetical protein
VSFPNSLDMSFGRHVLICSSSNCSSSMLPEDQKQPQIARVMKIVPEQSTPTPSAPTPASAPAQEEPAAATQAANEDFGYEDEDAELDESEEDDGWEVPKKFVGSGNANGGSFAAIAGSSRGEHIHHQHSGILGRAVCAYQTRTVYAQLPRHLH